MGTVPARSQVSYAEDSSEWYLRFPEGWFVLEEERADGTIEEATAMTFDDAKYNAWIEGTGDAVIKHLSLLLAIRRYGLE